MHPGHEWRNSLKKKPPDQGRVKRENSSWICPTYLAGTKYFARKLTAVAVMPDIDQVRHRVATAQSRAFDAMCFRG